MVQFRDPGLQETAYEMGTGDVEIGEVRAVRFMEIVVAFVER